MDQHRSKTFTARRGQREQESYRKIQTDAADEIRKTHRKAVFLTQFGNVPCKFRENCFEGDQIQSTHFFASKTEIDIKLAGCTVNAAVNGRKQGYRTNANNIGNQ